VFVQHFLSVVGVGFIFPDISSSFLLGFFHCFPCHEMFSFHSGLNCVRLNAKSNDKYSFAKFKGDGVSYVSNIVNGQYTNVPYGPAPSTAL
jgi:hypothetical protein